MSDLRTAAQQALEAFDPKNGHAPDVWPFHVKGLQAQACKALRAALAEPEPFRPDWDRVEALQESLREHMEEVRQLRAALAAAVAEERERCATLVEDTQRQYPGDGLDGWLLAHEMRSYAAAALAEPDVPETRFGNKAAAVAEPLAWIQPDHLQKARRAPFLCRVEPTQRFADFVPLYAAPPQREPYDQTALGLCNACGWKAVGPDGCLNCAPQREREPLTDEQIDAGIEAWFTTGITTNDGKDRGRRFRQRMRAAIERARSAAPASAAARWWLT